MSVVKAVEGDLKRLAKRDRVLADSALAATALALAAEIDGDNSATSKSMCARALAECLERLWDQAPPAEESDGVDDLAKRRAKRRSASAS